MGKKKKAEYAFFIGENGRRQYNALCRKCRHPCKQSFQAIIMACPKYLSKRSLRRP